MNHLKIKNIVLCGFGIAVTFVLTAFIAIPIGQFGYVNLGDAAIMLFASILNPAFAFLVGAVGSAASDMYLGFSQYALFSFVVKGIEAVCICLLMKHLSKKLSVLAYLIGMIIMVLGYYGADFILLGNGVAALGGVGFNFMQGIICCVVASFAHVIFINSAKKHFID